jgi:hypothetical protein
MGVACRCLGEGTPRCAHIFAGIAVDIVSQFAIFGNRRWLAAKPVGPIGADDGIADLERIDTIADRNHLSGAIGQRNAAIGAGFLPCHNHAVMEVQRTGPDPDQHFTQPRFGAIFLKQPEIFQASRRRQPDQSHENLPRTFVRGS